MEPLTETAQPAELEQLDEVAVEGQAPDLEDPGLYFSRELSWLDFNDRVLQLAEDPSVPLLERAKFAAIWESNLDEEFMLRIANLRDMLESGTQAKTADGMSATETLAAARTRVLDQRQRAGRTVERELRPALAEHGIRILTPEQASPEEREELEHLFERQVFPVLTPLVIGRGRPFPYISNLSLSLAVVLRDPEKDNEILARVKVPKELLRRFLSVGDNGDTLVTLDSLIAANLGSLFPGMEVIDQALFRVTRDTDYDVSDETGDLLQAVEEELRRRRFGEVVRLEIDARMSEPLRDQLIAALDVSADEVYEVEGLLDLADLWDVVGLSGHDDLRDPPFTPVTPPRLLLGPEGKESDLFAAIRGGDILVHHPYDSFATTVERFVKQAVSDPDVLAIKQTVYRTSADSPLVPNLIEAAERGKQAVCLVELKARFDESANIRWAKKLEQAGVHVVYGIPALKTHVKCILVVRREGDGVRHYVHIGTGNYNPKTARIYTDLGLFTADAEIGADIAEMFNSLTGYARPRSYREVLVAPFNLQKGILGEIDRTIASHSSETPGRIRLKMNSLLDAPSIRALYRASQAGVEVEINVRGICALRPGVEGISDRITVRSVVGRFLEHSRIYSFERHGEPASIYIGSADLMPRNLYNRVELVAPVQDDKARAELMDVLDRSLADNTNSWELNSEGEWIRREPGDEPRNVQREMIEIHSERSASGATVETPVA